MHHSEDVKSTIVSDGGSEALRLLVSKIRAAYDCGKTRPYAHRKRQLSSFLQFLRHCGADLIAAMHQDMQKPYAEASMEVTIAKSHVAHVHDSLEEWSRPEPIPKRLIESLYEVYVQREPYGVVLIMTAWNVPLLTLLPVAGAIAAGNAIIIKPSHNTPHFNRILCTTLPQYLDTECYAVLDNVDIVATQQLLNQQRFDYIYYTGSWHAGQLVHRAANHHLTPTTLELGGKSPVYIDSTADLHKAVERIVWGKFFNLGQTCIAPDYVLCTRAVACAFVAAAAPIMRRFYGEDARQSSSLARIINVHHYRRLVALLKDVQVVIGGGVSDEEALFIEPTIAVDVARDHPLMQEEIFGPILPIVVVESVDDAITNVINARGKPLAMYVFSRSKHVRRVFLERTSSGAITINDTMLHLVVENLPFGGVGASGMGRYKGRDSFETFSHRRSVLRAGFCPAIDRVGQMRYPPYDMKTVKRLQFLLKYRKGVAIPWGLCSYIVVFLLGVVLSILVIRFLRN